MEGDLVSSLLSKLLASRAGGEGDRHRSWRSILVLGLCRYGRSETSQGSPQDLDLTSMLYFRNPILRYSCLTPSLPRDSVFRHFSSSRPAENCLVQAHRGLQKIPVLPTVTSLLETWQWTSERGGWALTSCVVSRLPSQTDRLQRDNDFCLDMFKCSKMLCAGNFEALSLNTEHVGKEQSF